MGYLSVEFSFAFDWIGQRGLDSGALSDGGLCLAFRAFRLALPIA